MHGGNMKTFDLASNKENVIKTYLNDSIQRNYYLHRFIQILDSIDDGFSIALGGNWGNGKTFFVKQAKMILDSHNPFIENFSEEEKEQIQFVWSNYNRNKTYSLKNQVCVYYDAWKYDNDDDPILSLIYEIARELGTNYNFTEESSTAKVVVSLLELLSGRNIKDFYNTLKSQKDLMEGIENERKISEQINDFFDSVLEERGDRLVIFIDELDRCKPSYAVNLLEKIKHYFSNERITFVFSINSVELINTIQKYYGQSFDSGRYLDRFFDLRLDLPQIDNKCFLEYMGFKIRNSYIQDKVVLAVVNYFRLEMREITRYLKLVKIAIYKPIHASWDLHDSERLCIQYIIPVMLGLKLYDIKKYFELINGKDCTPLIEVLSDFKNDNLFQKLLNDGEDYNTIGVNTVHVKIEDKISRVYDAIFKTKYSPTKENKMIGLISFDAENKKMIEETINLFSDYIDIS